MVAAAVAAAAAAVCGFLARVLLDNSHRIR